MKRCVSPIPSLPPTEIRTDLTCATLDFDTPVVVEPSNCVCPDTVLEFPVGNYEFVWDKYWYVGIPPTFYDRQYIVALLVNKDGRNYSQIFTHSRGECHAARRRRIEVQVLNLPGLQKIACIDYDDNGAIIATHYDVDMSAVFGDGQEHWVFIVSYEPSASITGTRVLVDDQPVGDITRSWNEISDFVKLQVSGNVADSALPFAMWQYQQSIEQCLTSGIFNGFGGCQALDQKEALKWDRGLTDINVDLFNDDRVAVPKEGAPTRRSAYLIHPPMVGRVYWEVERGRSASCFTDGSWSYGCAERQLDLGDLSPGFVVGSWGLNDNLNRLFADGNQLASDIPIAHRQYFCYDVQTRELWIGYEFPDHGDLTWYGGGIPGAGATSWVLFPVVRDLRIVHTFNEYPASIHVVSSEKSCHFPAPPGFGYLT